MKSMLLTALFLTIPSFAKDVRMAFCMELPPYIIQGTNSGIQLDIMKEALALKGHKLIPVYMSFERAKLELQENRIDAIERGAPYLTDDEKIFFAKDFTVAFKDVAISLKDNSFKINSIKDLKDRSILAFKGASFYLENYFRNFDPSHQKYRETTDQSSQVSMLSRKRVDVVISDELIFKYHHRNYSKNNKNLPEYVVHDIFQNNTYPHNRAAFRDKKIRDDFNYGLEKIKNGQRYKQIIDAYTLAIK